MITRYLVRQWRDLVGSESFLANPPKRGSTLFPVTITAYVLWLLVCLPMIALALVLKTLPDPFDH